LVSLPVNQFASWSVSRFASCLVGKACQWFGLFSRRWVGGSVFLLFGSAISQCWMRESFADQLDNWTTDELMN